MDSAVICFFDGLCEPNPGGITCASYVIEPHAVVPAGVEAVYLGHGEGMTNNVAEYDAAVLALRAIYKTGWRGRVVLRGDSRLVCKQYTGDYACDAPLLVPRLERLRRAATHFARLELQWIPREENERADGESRRLYRELTGSDAPVRQRRRSNHATPR